MNINPHGVPPAVEKSEREEPEHRGDRRRFLMWALMAGFVKPERVTERVVAELQREADVVQ